MTITFEQLADATAQSLCKLGGIDPYIQVRKPAPRDYKGVVGADGQIAVEVWQSMVPEVKRFLRMTEAVRLAHAELMAASA